ncbi:hypothetical protein [Actibacterium sp. 188UL27-1]|uniref:hypothetical protein n=1 Tax=Actibacterium sp. 188UL27-1 TaxID=2786961 RepID=UPI00195C95EF|nr:hypothetical protein [Actibacterium sp. 188UL27-1]MBM7066989.1 hypothetical protein [Actibacterium sp. 188UL27-1]
MNQLINRIMHMFVSKGSSYGMSRDNQTDAQKENARRIRKGFNLFRRFTRF